ncbi:SdpI family protein [Desulfobacca acetoxidans]|uniref:SdpI family protein n=1 Tax=Desulfobacca acetoxidans (strain ATCC 700848 / DSM 11109 / ASRB2) TaxID=880072 RepID=F2NDM8_DESAR|nr:SdpI family protein [Desulfobacca acetoxidans]AEB10304.1 hypothetical protein Desac_2483 [Desulfobacca acetoxidans DSM 11109]
MIPPLPLFIVGAVLCGLSILMLCWHPGPNAWIGVRLPWTYADRELWDTSWRLGIVLVLGMGLGAFISWQVFIAATVVLLGVSLGCPMVIYYRKYGTLRFWKDQGWIAYHPVVRCRHCGHYQKLPDDAALSTAQCEACGRPYRI